MVVLEQRTLSLEGEEIALVKRKMNIVTVKMFGCKFKSLRDSTSSSVMMESILEWAHQGRSKVSGESLLFHAKYRQDKEGVDNTHLSGCLLSFRVRKDGSVTSFEDEFEDCKTVEDVHRKFKELHLGLL